MEVVGARARATNRCTAARGAHVLRERAETRARAQKGAAAATLVRFADV